MSLESAVCMGCGCTDDEPCKDGCAWLRIDYARGVGVCSSCPGFEAAFDEEASEIELAVLDEMGR